MTHYEEFKTFIYSYFEDSIGMGENENRIRIDVLQRIIKDYNEYTDKLLEELAKKELPTNEETKIRASILMLNFSNDMKESVRERERKNEIEKRDSERKEHQEELELELEFRKMEIELNHHERSYKELDNKIELSYDTSFVEKSLLVAVIIMVFYLYIFLL